MKKCPNCKEKVIGRSDKIFCTSYCKSSYHYQKDIQKDKNLFRKIDKQIKLNRRLLKLYNKSGKAVVRKEELLKEGFNPKYFTHYWKNKKDDIYLFVYEFGFLKKKESNVEKYILIKWQEYME